MLSRYIYVMLRRLDIKILYVSFYTYFGDGAYLHESIHRSKAHISPEIGFALAAQRE